MLIAHTPDHSQRPEGSSQLRVCAIGKYMKDKPIFVGYDGEASYEAIIHPDGTIVVGYSDRSWNCMPITAHSVIFPNGMTLSPAVLTEEGWKRHDDPGRVRYIDNEGQYRAHQDMVDKNAKAEAEAYLEAHRAELEAEKTRRDVRIAELKAQGMDDAMAAFTAHAEDRASA
jgi:hypothetical protein